MNHFLLHIFLSILPFLIFLPFTIKPRKTMEIVDLINTSGGMDNELSIQLGINLDELEMKAEENGIVRCHTCGWWVEVDETNEEGNCEDCQRN